MIAPDNSDIPSRMIDTNVILRFLLNDEPKMSQKAKKLFERASDNEVFLIVSECSFIELVFVLEKVMKFSREQVSHALQRFLGLPGILTLTPNTVLLQALNFYEKSSKPWPDCIIAATALGNQITEIYSFDHHFNSFEGLTRLSP